MARDIKRNLAKINYRIHTDAIKENLIPPELSARQISLVYANEVDVLNMALFGMTAKEWRDAHPDIKGNIRDYANVSQLVCLSNLENLNAVFINEGIPQAERLVKLNAIAISQMKVLTEDHRMLQLVPILCRRIFGCHQHTEHGLPSPVIRVMHGKDDLLHLELKKF